MKKLILLALAPLVVVANPARAQTTIEQRTIEHPDGSVTRTITRDDNGYREERTVERTDGRDDDRDYRDDRRYNDNRGYDDNRRYDDRRAGDDRRYDDRRAYGDRRWEGNRRVVRQQVERQRVVRRVVRQRVTPRVVRQCRTVVRHNRTIQTCTVIRARY
jgi:hypothetical protein